MKKNVKQKHRQPKRNEAKRGSLQTKYLVDNENRMSYN